MSRTRTMTGFTLIELMIALAIVGILAGIAYPSYTQYIQESRRHDGKTALLEAMQKQKQYFTRENTYTTDLSQLEGYDSSNPTSESEYYKLTAEQCTDSGGSTISLDRCVRLKAEPQGVQADDDTLTYNSRGVKTPENLWK